MICFRLDVSVAGKARHQQRGADMHQILESAGFPVSKPELSVLFRQPDHKSFRLCGDHLLRSFLKGLTMRLRGNG